MAEQKEGKWVTLDNGVHLFIKKGQTLDDAIEQNISKDKRQEQEDYDNLSAREYGLKYAKTEKPKRYVDEGAKKIHQEREKAKKENINKALEYSKNHDEMSYTIKQKGGEPDIEATINFKTGDIKTKGSNVVRNIYDGGYTNKEKWIKDHFEDTDWSIKEQETEIKPEIKKQVASWDNEMKYRMLSRMQSDVNYYLGASGRSNKSLWAGNPQDHIAYMEEIYNSLKEKPKWLSKTQLRDYKEELLNEGKPSKK